MAAKKKVSSKRGEAGIDGVEGKPGNIGVIGEQGVEFGARGPLGELGEPGIDAKPTIVITDTFFRMGNLTIVDPKSIISMTVTGTTLNVTHHTWSGGPIVVKAPLEKGYTLDDASKQLAKALLNHKIWESGQCEVDCIESDEGGMEPEESPS